jgi:hypothetical protein
MLRAACSVALVAWHSTRNEAVNWRHRPRAQTAVRAVASPSEQGHAMTRYRRRRVVSRRCRGYSSTRRSATISPWAPAGLDRHLVYSVAAVAAVRIGDERTAGRAGHERRAHRDRRDVARCGKAAHDRCSAVVAVLLVGTAMHTRDETLGVPTESGLAQPAEQRRVQRAVEGLEA